MPPFARTSAVGAARCAGRFAGPPDSQPELGLGDVLEVTFAIEDDGGWRPFCVQGVTVQVDHHSCDEGGKIITSIGADVPLDLACD